MIYPSLNGQLGQLEKIPRQAFAIDYDFNLVMSGVMDACCEILNALAAGDGNEFTGAQGQFL